MVGIFCSLEKSVSASVIGRLRFFSWPNNLYKRLWTLNNMSPLTLSKLFQNYSHITNGTLTNIQFSWFKKRKKSSSSIFFHLYSELLKLQWAKSFGCKRKKNVGRSQRFFSRFKSTELDVSNLTYTSSSFDLSFLKDGNVIYEWPLCIW